jgi:hypothetical protein
MNAPRATLSLACLLVVAALLGARAAERTERWYEVKVAGRLGSVSGFQSAVSMPLTMPRNLPLTKLSRPSKCSPYSGVRISLA